MVSQATLQPDLQITKLAAFGMLRCLKLILILSSIIKCLFFWQGPVTVKVVIPNVVDKPEWKLNGQTLEYTLPLTDTVSLFCAQAHPSVLYRQVMV